MEKNKFWDEICPKILRMANTLKNYTSKLESAYNNIHLLLVSNFTQFTWRILDFRTQYVQKI